MKQFQNTSHKLAFTLVELIVVITILAILGTIAFISMQGYSKSARNATVINDIGLIEKNLELFTLQTGQYPEPDGPISGIISVFNQGFVGDNVFTNLGKLNKKPVNPLTQEEYVYSRTQFGNYYELMGELEGNDSLIGLTNNSYADGDKIAYIKGNYNQVLAYTYSGAVNGGTHYIMSLPSLISNTGALLEYNQSNEILLVDGMNVSEGINYIPKSWAGTELPNDLDDIENIMGMVVDSFTGTVIKNNGIIGDILNSVDDVSYITGGRDLINNSLGGKIDLGDVTSRTCELDGGYAKQDWENGVWGECYREYCYAGFVENGEFDCDRTGDLLLQASNFEQNDEPKYQTKINSQGNKVFYRDGTIRTSTSGFIPIDTSKTYRISGDFRNVGLSPNRIYFGLESFDENKDVINAWDNLRKGNASTITSYDDDTIFTDTILEGWNNLENPYWHQQLIGFYYDGDTNKLPDDIMLRFQPYSIEERTTAYSSIDGQNILLNRSIPEEIAQNIILGTTKVMNHYSGSTYIYTYSPSDLSSDWQSTVSELNGEMFNGGINTFRMGTKYVKVYMFPNYNRYSLDYKIEFDNIHFEEID